MLKSVAKIFSSHIVVKALGLFNVIIILSFFSVEEFGKYSYLLVLLHLVGVIIDPFLSADKNGSIITPTRCNKTSK